MRFVDGEDLRALSPLAPARAAAIVAQVGAALDAAHARRLVHRDVKPGNVLVAGGDHAYLTDFGLVKALDASTGVTQTGELVGTVDYVAPERIRGAPAGPASDLYSLGCVLFYALTGRVVYPLDSAEQRMWAHISGTPPPFPGFDAVLERALAKDPGERYPTGRALGEAALAAATGAPPDPLEAARRSERGIRAAAPGSPVAVDAARALGALEHAAGRARLLREALAETPPEAVERRLAEVRAGSDPGKARLVAALARRLAVQRRMQAALAAFDAEVERILVELETARGRVLADDAAAGEPLAALQDELETLAERLATALERNSL
jgi:serine/threonine-protein kinase